MRIKYETIAENRMAIKLKGYKFYTFRTKNRIAFIEARSEEDTPIIGFEFQIKDEHIDRLINTTLYFLIDEEDENEVKLVLLENKDKINLSRIPFYKPKRKK